MAVDLLLENDTYVSQLRSAIGEGESALSNVPGLLKCILKDDRWRKRTIRQTGEPANFTRFEKFVKALPLEGLGADMPLIRRICAGDEEALDLLDKALKGRQGERTDLAKKPPEKTPEVKTEARPANPKGNFVDNVNEVQQEPRPDGNSSARAIRHLREKRPDLHAKVIARELSPNAAMIEAGFRKKTVTISVDPASAARVLRRHFDRDQLRELARLLMSQEGGQ